MGRRRRLTAAGRSIRRRGFLPPGRRRPLTRLTLRARAGDTVLVEEPAYSLIGGVFPDRGLNVAGAATDGDGHCAVGGYEDALRIGIARYETPELVAGLRRMAAARRSGSVAMK